MNKKFLIIILLSFVLININNQHANAGIGFAFTASDTDTATLSTFQGESLGLFYVFDLRDRETFIQFTYPDPRNSGFSAIAHIQIFDVSNNCNENDFFDNYTVNDTHTYNMRDIQTNDGNPSGVVLPEGSYGIVAITFRTFGPDILSTTGAIGSLRIVDNNGYEYRTNAQNLFGALPSGDQGDFVYTINFNSEEGIILSDVMGVTVNIVDVENSLPSIEWDASDPLTAFNPFDIDIFNNNEVPFSCRNVTFSGVDQDNPLLEELLEFSGTNVASFEYGINNAIPHSKGGELLCPGNIINDGFVRLTPLFQLGGEFPYFLGFAGLNNGNGRGTMDSLWIPQIPFNQ